MYLCLVPPEIITDVTDEMESGKNPVTFTCRATGAPLPSLSWYYNGNKINPSEAFEISISASGETVVESSLTIINPQSSDVGTYTCQAENNIGSAESSGMLTNGKNTHLTMLPC